MPFYSLSGASCSGDNSTVGTLVSVNLSPSTQPVDPLLPAHPSLPAQRQIHGTCLGFQLLHILVSNVSRNDLLIETDSVAHPSTLIWSGKEKDSRLFKTMPVRRSCGPQLQSQPQLSSWHGTAAPQLQHAAVPAVPKHLALLYAAKSVWCRVCMMLQPICITYNSHSV